MLNRFKQGYSFVELLLTLMFFFLIIAAIMPMITRRHLQPPEKVFHGFYACYRDEANEEKFHEVYIKGNKLLNNPDALIDECHFEQPGKAKYFYVQIIGGGGAGADVAWDTDSQIYNDPRLYLSHVKQSWSGGIVSGNGSSPISWTDEAFPSRTFNEFPKMNVTMSGSSSSGDSCRSNSYSAYRCAMGQEDSDKGECEYITTTKDNVYCSDAGKNADGEQQWKCTKEVPASEATGEGCSIIQRYVYCTNDKYGSGSSGSYTIGFPYGLTISESKISSSPASSLPYSQAPDGTGVSLSGGGHTLNVYPGQGAEIGQTYKSLDSTKGENCLSSSYYTYAADGYCDVDGSTSRCGGKSSDANGSVTLSYTVTLTREKHTQSQELSYGYGGLPGEVKTMILKKIPDDLKLYPGHGGKVIGHEGKDGETSYFGDKDSPTAKKAKGGRGGHTDTGYLDVPLSLSGGTFSTLSAAGRIGGKTSFQNFINYVLSTVFDANVRPKVVDFGKGGDGSAYTENCTKTYLYEPFTIADMTRYVDGHSTPPSSALSTCGAYSWNGTDSGYWAGAMAAHHATKGGSGAIVISW